MSPPGALAAAPAERSAKAPGRSFSRRLLFWNFNAVHRFDRWVRRRFTPAGRLLLGAMVLGMVFGINTRAAVAYQLAVLSLALLAGAAAWAPFFRPRLVVTRRLPRYAQVGAVLRYTLAVRNEGGSAQAGVSALDELVPAQEVLAAGQDRGEGGGGRGRRRSWLDRRVGYPRWTTLMRDALGAAVHAVALPALQPGHSATAQVALTPLRRGYLRFDRVRFLRPDPLGIFNAQIVRNAPGHVLVLPRRHPVRWQPGFGPRARESFGTADSARLGGAEEFASIREYRPGDSLRHLHWRGWARYGFPVVKEFHDRRQARRAVLLDLELGPDGSQGAFEAAVEVAASFCGAAEIADGASVLLLGTTLPMRVEAGEGSGDAPQLEALACVQPAPAGSLARLSDFALRQADALDACICVLLDWDDARRALVEGLRAASLPVLALVVEPGGETGGAVPRQPRPDPAHGVVRISSASVGAALAGLEPGW